MTPAHRAARTRGKVWEREVAAALGTKRTGPTGMDDADIIHEVLGVECKAYTRLALREADLQQMVRNAKGRIPLLALKEFGSGRKYWVMQFEFGTQLLLDFLEDPHGR